MGPSSHTPLLQCIVSQSTGLGYTYVKWNVEKALAHLAPCMNVFPRMLESPTAFLYKLGRDNSTGTASCFTKELQQNESGMEMCWPIHLDRLVKFLVSRQWHCGVSRLGEIAL